MKGDGPQDYEEMDAKFGNLLGGIAQTVFIFTLRRYFLDEMADLYEQDYRTFEIHREVGRRVLSDDDDREETCQILDSYFLRTYGEGELTRMKARVEELRAWRD